MKLTALKRHRYAGKMYDAGESYEAKDKDVKVLTAVGFSALSDDPTLEQPKPKRKYRRRDMQAETTGTAEIEP